MGSTSWNDLEAHELGLLLCVSLSFSATVSVLWELVRPVVAAPLARAIAWRAMEGQGVAGRDAVNLARCGEA